LGPASIDLEHFRQKLLELRNELHAVQETGNKAAETVELDQTRVGRLSRMDALQAQSMSMEVSRRREAQLKGLGAALNRIEHGTYGECVICEEPIHPDRLEFDPATTTCVTCARAQEV